MADRVCCCWGRRGSAIARTRQCLVAHAVRLTLRGRATHEYSKERIHSALGLGSPWRLVLCVHHTTRITMSSSLPGRFRSKSGMERLRRSLTWTACDLPRGLRSAAPRLSGVYPSRRLPVDLHRTALEAHAHQCFAALAANVRMRQHRRGTSRRALLARGDWSCACTSQLVNRSTGLACPKLTRIACAH